MKITLLGARLSIAVVRDLHSEAVIRYLAAEAVPRLDYIKKASVMDQ